jgi:hypothetical protein
MVAQLGDHPALLRRLGLIVDLVVDLPEPHMQLPADGIVRLLPEGELPENPPTCPGTRYELDKRWFGAKQQNDIRMARGLLRLNKEFYDLFQVDVDVHHAGDRFCQQPGTHAGPQRRPGYAERPACPPCALPD